MDASSTQPSPSPTPAAVAPRWEWRTFGASLAANERVFATPDAVQESDEVYLLAHGRDASNDAGGGEAAGTQSVKIRDGLIDIKTLHEVDARGLEQWSPTMKEAFPLPADRVGRVFAALVVQPPPLERSEYTIDQFLDELMSPAEGVRVVGVHKLRRRYSVEEAMAEVSEVTADGTRTRTIAAESTDPDAVMAAIRAAGLGQHLNVSYPRGLSALLTNRAPRYAVIDVGTNSVKLHVAERQADGSWNRLADRAVMSRLGEGLAPGGDIGAEPLGRTAAAVAGMADEARRTGATELAAVGTAGLRSARNGRDVVAEIAKRTGVEVEVISGEEEARLAYHATAVAAGVGHGRVTVFDTGGGSSQFTFGVGGKVEERFSVDVGAVRLTERYGLDGTVPLEGLTAALEGIGAELSALDGRERPDALIGMGGAMTNLAAVHLALATYDPDAVQGHVLDRAEIERQIELYRSQPADERRSIVGLQPNRAEVILAGACIVRTVMDKLGADALRVSDRGLRHGVLLERFGTEEGTPPMATKPTQPARRAPRRKAPAASATSAETAKAAEPAAASGDGKADPTQATDTAPRLSDADLQEVMRLIKGADSVELKITVPASAQRATVQGLPIDPVEAQPRQVFFFDTPDLALNNAGVIVRARRIQGGKADTVVKLRPVVPDELPAELRKSSMFKTEVDVVPGGFVCSGSLKGTSTGEAVRDAVAGEKPLRKLFSKEQRAFYAAHAPEGLELDSLRPLGPTFILKGTFTPKEMGRRFVVEVWLYPDGSRILELSTKAAPSEAFQVAAEARAYLIGLGIDLAGAQEPKTRAALEFYASELQA
jgi:exopolyphosphatase/guanosine-5'-triphosphate,3'-diphosphate pyrophosphatase